jgi:hypothetical protein
MYLGTFISSSPNAKINKMLISMVPADATGYYECEAQAVKNA